MKIIWNNDFNETEMTETERNNYTWFKKYKNRYVSHYVSLIFLAIIACIISCFIGTAKGTVPIGIEVLSILGGVFILISLLTAQIVSHSPKTLKLSLPKLKFVLSLVLWLYIVSITFFLVATIWFGGTFHNEAMFWISIVVEALTVCAAFSTITIFGKKVGLF